MKVSEESIGRLKADLLGAGKSALAAGKSGPSTPVDPVVGDVDIVLPVRWDDDVLEEIDLKLDVLRSAE